MNNCVSAAVQGYYGSGSNEITGLGRCAFGLFGPCAVIRISQSVLEGGGWAVGHKNRRVLSFVSDAGEISSRKKTQLRNEQAASGKHHLPRSV